MSLQGKVRFAENLSQGIVTVEGRTVTVHCLGYVKVQVDCLPDDNPKRLRSRIHELIKGTPADASSVERLIDIAL